uniref:Uncharacterized protein n=1 Tax=viral metagenome TaxID=1070528 RepID=A0A6C0BMD8_9ZZZZ
MAHSSGILQFPTSLLPEVLPSPKTLNLPATPFPSPKLPQEKKRTREWRQQNIGLKVNPPHHGYSVQRLPTSVDSQDLRQPSMYRGPTSRKCQYKCN